MKTSPARKKATILVTEDDEASLQFLSIIIRSLGFRSLGARTGEEAVALCQANQDIALVLMDIKMPIMDGLEATRLIKMSRPKLPVIAQTAFALESEKAEYSTSFDDYLTKPIKTDNLKRIIKLYLTDGTGG